MKRYRYNLLFIFLMIISYASSCQGVLFLFLPEAGGSNEKLMKMSKGFNDIFLSDAFNAMEKDFPCAGITEPGGIELVMNELRLQGTPAFGSRNVQTDAINGNEKTKISIDFSLSHK